MGVIIQTDRKDRQDLPDLTRVLELYPEYYKQFQEAEHWWQLIVPGVTAGTFFVLVAGITNTIASQDGDDFSTDEILAELTGEKPATAPPSEDKGFELPAFELPKLPNPFE